MSTAHLATLKPIQYKAIRPAERKKDLAKNSLIVRT